MGWACDPGCRSLRFVGGNHVRHDAKRRPLSEMDVQAGIHGTVTSTTGTLGRQSPDETMSTHSLRLLVGGVHSGLATLVPHGLEGETRIHRGRGAFGVGGLSARPRGGAPQARASGALPPSAAATFRPRHQLQRGSSQIHLDGDAETQGPGGGSPGA